MRKIVLFAIVLFSFLVFLVAPIFAQENSVGNQASPSAVVNIDYPLPYPGLLSDNPLYIFRVLRDAVVGFLISDPLKKAEFDLLQADKRLSAGIYLSNQKKYELANTTISKGENYLEDALVKLQDAKKQGEIIRDISANIYLSTQKHQQITQELENQTSGNLKKEFENDNKRAGDIGKRVKQISPNQ